METNCQLMPVSAVCGPANELSCLVGWLIKDPVCRCLDISAVTLLNRTLDSKCNVTCGEGQESGTKCGGKQEHVVSLYRILGFERHDKQQIICENKPGNVTCPTHTVIRIKDANYGFTKETENCDTNKIFPPKKNCRHANSTAIMRQLCNRKQTCTVTPSNRFFGSDPCSWTTKLLNISYTCVPKGSEEDLCRVFKVDSSSQTVNLQSVPCDSKVNLTACTTYNETEQKDSIEVFTHTGAWSYAVNTLCSEGYIPPTDNITKMKLLQTNQTNASIWSGYIRQRVDVDDIDRNLNGSKFVQCYALERDTLVRSDCTEQRQYICQKEMVADETTTGPILTTDNTPSGNGIPSPSDAVMTVGNTVPTTTPTTATTSSGKERVTLPRPRSSSREDSKVIGLAAGITVGCIALVAVTAVVVDRLSKRSAKKKKQRKKKTKEKPVQFKGSVINAQNAMNSIKSDTSSDESESESKMAARTSSPGEAGAKQLPSVSYNYDIVNEIGTEKGHVNDAYAYAATDPAGSEEGDYDAMELCIMEDDEDHIYAHTMLPLPDTETDATDVVPKQPDDEAYDVMQSKVKVPGNDSAYDYTASFSQKNGTKADGGYDVFNRKVKDGVEDTYDHTQSVLDKNGDVNNTMYDAFTGKVESNEEISNDMYDHTKHMHKGQEAHTGDVSTNNIYDTCNDKAKVVDDVDDMYDHTTHVRENQDENLYDLASKRKINPSVDKNHYDQM
ncbi:uncharacterized protein LOC110455822 isoform X3 [Mizuhopecten yessoensis]|uniref:uncharacterized protein LOC110455822 isoform X3 n=1 Tax=Mizuhopecten yessoensis TaxID=6573 RepID=UPI000B45D99F|nr:uncharacterized protein LOC110455822 isoform X3 [Mizuhopecten yessoensis]